MSTSSRTKTTQSSHPIELATDVVDLKGYLRLTISDRKEAESATKIIEEEQIRPWRGQEHWIQSVQHFPTVEQPKGSRLCAGACAALLTCKPLHQVLDWFGIGEDHEGYFPEVCLELWLMMHGITCLRGAKEWNPETHPAYVQIQTGSNKFHANVWDGKSLRDPSGKVPKTLDKIDPAGILPLEYSPIDRSFAIHLDRVYLDRLATNEVVKFSFESDGEIRIDSKQAPTLDMLRLFAPKGTRK